MKTPSSIRPRCLAIASALSLTALFVGACQPESMPGPTPPATNGPVQTQLYVPDDWIFVIDDAANATTAAQYGHRLVKDTANEVGYLLSARTTDTFNAASRCYWKATVPDYVIDRIRPGSTLRLKALVQLTDVAGEGAGLNLECGVGTIPATARKQVIGSSLLATTQHVTPMRGTADFAEYVVELPYAAYTPDVTLYLMLLPGTTGTAVFRNVTLEIR